MSCGTPTPATMRVVQIEPGPTPTLTASTPASISALRRLARSRRCRRRAASFGNFLRVRRTASSTPAEWPCAVSMQITSQPAAISASMRSSRSAPTPTAAPTRSRPRSSVAARRVRLGLLDVADRDEALELAAAVDDEQLLDPVLVQEVLAPPRSTTPSFTVTGFFVITSPTCSVEPLLEPHVAVGEDADRALLAHRRPAGR